MNTTITVVDARMGRGKSTAAMRYMNEHKEDKRFLYITPFLDEVSRVCEQCDFDKTSGDYMSKSTELKLLLARGENIAATHALFYLMDGMALTLIREQHYCLIIDESIQVVERLNITAKDTRLIVEQLTEEDEEGRLHWKDDEYDGRFSDYKGMADTGSLYRLDSALINVLSPKLIEAFDEVFMLTYLFEGQYQKAYLDYYGFQYRIVGVKTDEDGYYFSDKPDTPSPIDYGDLIHLASTKGLEEKIEMTSWTFSKNWFVQRGYDNPEMQCLRSSMRYFFEKATSGRSSSRLWTSFKQAREKLTPSNGRFRNNFLQISARATNEYRHCTDLAYIANRYADPNLRKFFATRGITIDEDKFALGEMLQWVWRSAIRDDKPINLYIPSRRMRELLIGWIKENNQAGGYAVGK